jgi:hypothetical protein
MIYAPAYLANAFCTFGHIRHFSEQGMILLPHATEDRIDDRLARNHVRLL